MPMPKSKKAVGLGNTLMNDRFGKGKGAERRKVGAITRTNHATGEEYVTNDRGVASWVKMRSITEQGALDEFLATAQLAGTDFTAQKMNNVKIIHTNQKNPYLLTDAEERQTLRRHRENRDRLTVPRRPQWDASTTPEELDKLERESFLVWRRGLAELQDNQDLLMTPFERNLEVWRQLWRVIERSDLVVQIVDARNPLLFRSADLEDYVKAVDGSKQNLMLINKADMMTDRQRRAWAAHLKEAKIAYKFFSAQRAKEQNELRDAEDEAAAEREREAGLPSSSRAPATKADEEDEEESEEDVDEKEASDSDSLDIRILTVEELEDLFLQHAPKSDDPDRKLQVGLVGYPNVGKSSTINALIGAKKVSVSSTPGKTKHFQTIHLSERVVLCDCPGLVFPNFATTKGDLVCNGILPIDQLREFSGPAGLVASRIPKHFLEAIYGIQIRTRNIGEGGTGTPTAEELLMAYARARGFTKAGQGQPDESRAARYILKDYVNGKLLFCAPPPGHGINPMAFNQELYDTERLPEKRRLAMEAAAAADTPGSAATVASTARSLKAMSLSKPNAWEEEESSDEDEEEDSSEEEEEEGEKKAEDESEEDEEDEEDDVSLDEDMVALPKTEKPSAKSWNLDKAFFQKASASDRGHVNMPFSHKYSEQGQAAGKQLSGRKERLMVALSQGMGAEEARRVAASAAAGKKHFKGGAKTRGKKKVPSNAIDD